MSLIITLVLVALVLFFFEILIPGGILAIIGVAVLFGASYAAYDKFGPVAAALTFFLSLTVSIMMLVIELILLPKIPLGKKLFLGSKNQSDSSPAQAKIDMTGKKGETLTTMAPTGMVLIEGRQYEASSQSGMLEKGAAVEVTAQDNFRLIVRKAG